nr:unnamed protein product [Digitaria exilis]
MLDLAPCSGCAGAVQQHLIELTAARGGAAEQRGPDGEAELRAAGVDAQATGKGLADLVAPPAEPGLLCRRPTARLRNGDLLASSGRRKKTKMGARGSRNSGEVKRCVEEF